jgi:hypothetical protein
MKKHQKKPKKKKKKKTAGVCEKIIGFGRKVNTKPQSSIRGNAG